MLKIKEVIIGICLPGAVTLRKMVRSIGTELLKENSPNSLSELWGNVIPTDMWARVVLKSMDWVKFKGDMDKVEPWKQLLAKEKFRFQMSISEVVCNMIYHQSWSSTLTRLSYLTSHLENTPSTLGAKNVAVKRIDDKR